MGLPRNQTQWRLSQLSVFARENGKQNQSFQYVSFSSLESELSFDADELFVY